MKVSNKPTWDAVNHGWWTGVDSDVCLTPIKDRYIRLHSPLVSNSELTCNFKFFGQQSAGVLSSRRDNSHLISTDSEVFGSIGDGNGHDNGNVYLKDGVELKNGRDIRSGELT